MVGLMVEVRAGKTDGRKVERKVSRLVERMVVLLVGLLDVQRVEETVVMTVVHLDGWRVEWTVDLTVAWMVDVLDASMEHVRAVRKELHSGSSWECLWVGWKVSHLVD